MKLLYLFVISLLSFCCASSQKSSLAEAKEDIDKIRTLINASADQALQLTKVQSIFLNKSKALEINKKADAEKLSDLKMKRNKSFKKILSREQYIKFSAIERSRDRDLPVRFLK